MSSMGCVWIFSGIAHWNEMIIIAYRCLFLFRRLLVPQRRKLHHLLDIVMSRYLIFLFMLFGSLTLVFTQVEMIWCTTTKYS